MADPRGFLRHVREGPRRRPVAERLSDWKEVYEPFASSRLVEQASRCMDCGIPFCHEGCPLGNLVPEWNDLVRLSRLDEAYERLASTNNFPEFTGRLCPAPCEGSCVLGIISEPVLIRQIELEVAEAAASSGSFRPVPAERSTGKRVAIVGSGPAGLAAAQQLTRAGHEVVVYERAERPGGLLRYGIPEFKMEKAVLDRRLAQMEAEGTRFEVGVSVGAPGGADGSAAGPGHTGTLDSASASAPRARTVTAAELLAGFDALVLAIGSTRPRDLDVPGRHLDGIHFAMEYLRPHNLVQEGALAEVPISAAGRRVVIVGGGDTGADCLGTVHREGALSVHQLEILPAPPASRAASNPWPTWPIVFRTSSAHEEGGERLFEMATAELLGDESGRVRALRLQRVGGPEAGPGGAAEAGASASLELESDLVLIAMGFAGPERHSVVAELGLELDGRGNVAVGGAFETSHARVYACGDMARGQSLVVWAIAEGRSAAAAVDRALMGRSALPAPTRPGQLALR